MMMKSAQLVVAFWRSRVSLLMDIERRERIRRRDFLVLINDFISNN